MVLRSEQGPYDFEPLRCHRDAPLTAPRDKLAEPINRVPRAPSPIHQPDFSHNHSWPATNRERDPNPGGEKYRLISQIIFSRYLPSPAPEDYSVYPIT
jgi:hypothetical protein